ncbi:MAG: hypothetical protein GY794_17720 [bacterium]|nr:hypothetical protein [bacterium]
MGLTQPKRTGLKQAQQLKDHTQAIAQRTAHPYVHLNYKDHPNFRPVPTFENARSTTAPLPEDKR